MYSYTLKVLKYTAFVLLTLALVAISPAAPRNNFQKQVAVLAYHNVAVPEQGDTISPQRLAAQMDYLQAHAFHFLTIEEMTHFLAKNTVPKKAVLVTFDDGYANFYSQAFPILRSRHIPAINFVIGAYAGKKVWSNEYLTWSQMREMQSQDISFQSHSYNQHELIPPRPRKRAQPMLAGYLFNKEQARLETNAEFSDRVHKDIQASKEQMVRELGRAPVFFAIPYGKEMEDAKRIFSQEGLPYQFSVKPGLVGLDSPRDFLPRIIAGRQGINGDELEGLILRYAK